MTSLQGHQSSEAQVEIPSDEESSTRETQLLELEGIPTPNEHGAEVQMKTPRETDLQYSIEDVPPWPLCILLGFQHYLMMFGSTLSIPLIMAPALCMQDDHVAKSEILSTMFLVSGIVTLLQTTFGSRLPIVQGGTFAFLSPMFAIMALPQWQCPSTNRANTTISDGIGLGVTTLYENATAVNVSFGDTEPPWKPRIREVITTLLLFRTIGLGNRRMLPPGTWGSAALMSVVAGGCLGISIQGAIVVASMFEVLLGFSGVLGLLLRYVGPLSITPTIALIGIALFKGAADFCAHQWWIAILTMALITFFSQYLRKVKLPFIQFLRGKGCGFVWYPAFKMFPVLMAIAVAWLVCYILTVTDVLPSDPTMWGHRARTDTKIQVLYKASWIRFPYPGQWGMPTVSSAGVLGMLAGVMAGTMESVGDYYAAARLSGAPPPPVHALNRGIFMEGLGCVLAGFWGSGNGTTSYSENVGAIGITKVGSRRVIQVGGIFMIMLALLGKFGALFVTLPDPIIGGVFMVMFGMITAVGISNLQYVDLNSSRNLFIFGFSLFFGLAAPFWISNNPGAINTGSIFVDQILTVLLNTSMFVGGALGFFLDNTIPGSDEERGITLWKHHLLDTGKSSVDYNKCPAPNCYDLPVGMKTIRRWKWARRIPISPTFVGFSCFKRTQK